MIRIREGDGWLLLKHPDHARLAGEFARHWGNDQFFKPEPIDSTLIGVARHDDAWADRDALPEVTSEGLPSAFTRELVGAYDAFEEIDFADYLKVRGQATEAVASDDPYAAILISMHTVNLLTEQADLSTLNEAEKAVHKAFIDGQLTRQQELAETLVAQDASWSTQTDPANLQKGFEFLQACDSLSLISCVRYESPLPLRHAHPTRCGGMVTIQCTPLGNDRYALAPYPFAVPVLKLPAPAIRVKGVNFADHAALRKAVKEGDALKLELEFLPGDAA